MRLLLDENLSFRLVAALGDCFPGSAHVRDAGLESADDEAVWRHAGAHGFALVSRDADFHDRAVLRGPPPKVVQVRRGNCATREVEAILRAAAGRIERFVRDPEAAVLILH